MASIKKLYVLTSLVLCIFLFACGASHHLRQRIEYRDENFSYSSLVNEGLIIGGLTAHQIELSREQRGEYSSELATIMFEKVKDAPMIRMVNNVQLAHTIGMDNYFAMMDSLDKNKKITESMVKCIRDTIPNIPYFLIAHIQNENIIDDWDSEYVTNESGGERKETTYYKTYLLTIDFRIYDLRRNKIVLDKYIFNEASKSETRSTRTGCVESCIDDIIQSILFGDAAEIDRKEVLKEIVEKFAKDLSKIN